MEKGQTGNVKGCGKWRIPFGLLLFWVIWIIGVLTINSIGFSYGETPFGVFLFIVILSMAFQIILYLFLFGVVGFWLLSLDILGAINPILLFFSKIIGYVGFFIRPFPILLYGGNKKWVLNVLVIFGVIPGFQIGDKQFGKVNAILTIFISLIYILFVLGIKKCPKCKCVMSEIDFDSVDISKTKYYRNEEEKVAQVKDSDGNKIDVCRNVTYEYDGIQNKFAKSCTCKRCGIVKYGLKFNAITRI